MEVVRKEIDSMVSQLPNDLWNEWEQGKVQGLEELKIFIAGDFLSPDNEKKI